MKKDNAFGEILTGLAAATIIGASALGAAAAVEEENRILEGIMNSVTNRTPMYAKKQLFDLYAGLKNKDLTVTEARDRLYSIRRSCNL